jgi:hypothetical protein
MNDLTRRRAERGIAAAIADLPPPDQFAALTEALARAYVESGLDPDGEAIAAFMTMTGSSLIGRIRALHRQATEPAH